jgi:uncharacterized RDD family membrane protein YckC
MTATMDLYIKRVIDMMPRGTPLRAQIAMELKSDIADRVERGEPMEDVLRHLGDPLTLAESYLSAVPLVSAPFLRRAAAKLIDFALFICLIAPFTWIAWRMENFMLAILLVPIGVVAFAAYIVIAEYRVGQTPGKRLLGLRVVRESGARIGLGQSIVRQLPVAFEFFWVDVMFALFTEKSQRAFELLSKTRVVRA